MYNSVALIVFTMLCIHYSYQLPTRVFITPNRNSIPIKQRFPPPSLVNLSKLLSALKNLSILGISCK